MVHIFKLETKKFENFNETSEGWLKRSQRIVTEGRPCKGARRRQCGIEGAGPLISQAAGEQRRRVNAL